MRTERVSRLIALAALATGCQAAPLPALQPGPGPVQAHLQAAAPGKGALHGFVFGASGRSQPLEGATVRVGELTTTTGRGEAGGGVGSSISGGKPVSVEDSLPKAPVQSPFNLPNFNAHGYGVLALPEGVLAAAHEFDDPANAEKTLMVEHDFGDGEPPRVVERHVRKHPVGADRSGKYVYLGAGEFLLEDVPAGPATVSADLCGRVSQPASVVVVADATLPGPVLNLDIPEPVAIEDGRTPLVMDAVGILPSSGLAFHVDNAGSASAKVVFEGPSKATLKVASSAGAGAITIKEADVVLVWASTSTAALGVPGPTAPHKRVPLVASSVAGTGICPGPTLDLTLDLAAVGLDAIFQQANASGLVVADINLIDDKGFAVQNNSFQNLSLQVPMFRH